MSTRHDEIARRVNEARAALHHALQATYSGATWSEVDSVIDALDDLEHAVMPMRSSTADLPKGANP